MNTTFKFVNCVRKSIDFLILFMTWTVAWQRKIRVTHGSSITVLMSLRLALEDIRLRSQLTQLQRTSFLCVGFAEVSEKRQRLTFRSEIVRWLSIIWNKVSCNLLGRDFCTKHDTESVNEKIITDLVPLRVVWNMAVIGSQFNNTEYPNEYQD